APTGERGRAVPVAPPSTTRVVGVDLIVRPTPSAQSSGQDQATIACRWAAPSSLDRDTAAMRVSNMILGGLFGSRLNLDLREQKGLTYGASSTYRRDETWGALTVDVAVPAQETDVALTVIAAEVARLATDPPTAAELAAARR